MSASALGGPGVIARALVALVVANVRYWALIAPSVRRELRRWELHAESIEDPELRALALQKLHDEGFHAEAAGMLATSAPRQHRPAVIEAIVALEVLYDHLDGLTERPSADPLREGERAFAPFIDAVRLGVAGTPPARGEHESYHAALARSGASAIASLPGAQVIARLAEHTARESAEAQIRMHAAPALGIGPLRQWASERSRQTGLDWREQAAGAASSVLVLHALIAAGADVGTSEARAGQIEASYLSTCVLLTLLDGIVDHERDSEADASPGGGYVELYEDTRELADVLAGAARRAAMHARGLADGGRHLMILVGVAGYYMSAPGAESAFARGPITRVREELSPLISPTLALMRGWRAIRRRSRETETRKGAED